MWFSIPVPAFPGAKKLFQLTPEIPNLDFPLCKRNDIMKLRSYHSHQVWTLVQSCLILFSLTLGIVVAASRSNFTFLRCIGREEAFGWSGTLNKLYVSFFRNNFSNFYKPDKFHGTEFLGPIWAPMRLLPNIPVFLFLLVVPALYGNIYIFRKKHSTTTIGWF